MSESGNRTYPANLNRYSRWILVTEYAGLEEEDFGRELFSVSASEGRDKAALPVRVLGQLQLLPQTVDPPVEPADLPGRKVVAVKGRIRVNNTRSAV